MENNMTRSGNFLESFMDKKLKYGKELGLAEIVDTLKKLTSKYKMDSLLIRLFEKQIFLQVNQQLKINHSTKIQRNKRRKLGHNYTKLSNIDNSIFPIISKDSIINHEYNIIDINRENNNIGTTKDNAGNNDIFEKKNSSEGIKDKDIINYKIMNNHLIPNCLDKNLTNINIKDNPFKNNRQNIMIKSIKNHINTSFIRNIHNKYNCSYNHCVSHNFNEQNDNKMVNIEELLNALKYYMDLDNFRPITC